MSGAARNGPRTLGRGRHLNWRAQSRSAQGLHFHIPCSSFNPAECVRCCYRKRRQDRSAATMSTTIVSTSVTETGHIPLTTNFTPPDSCVSDLWLGSTSGKTWMNLGPISHTECLPSGWAKTSYYSPGICPSGYGIAASGTVIDGSITETAATCCPT